MFQYYYRIYDQHRMPILSLAILADPDPNHRPSDLDLRIAGSGCLFQYHVCKLTDFTDEFLEASPNPVAKVVLAHRIAQRTAKDPSARMLAKVRWIRELIRQRFSRDQIEKLFRTLEAMNPLPEALDIEFVNQVSQGEPDTIMPFITTLERRIRRQVLAEGHSEALFQGQLLTLCDAIRDLLEERFGHTPPDIGERLEQETNPVVLKSWHRKTATIESVESFRRLLEPKT